MNHMHFRWILGPHTWLDIFHLYTHTVRLKADCKCFRIGGRHHGRSLGVQRLKNKIHNAKMTAEDQQCNNTLFDRILMCGALPPTLKGYGTFFLQCECRCHSGTTIAHVGEGFPCNRNQVTSPFGLARGSKLFWCMGHGLWYVVL